MSTGNMSTLAAILKTVYHNGIEELAFKKRPLLAKLRKNTHVGGDGFKLPVSYSDELGVSNDAATAFGNPSPYKAVAFMITQSTIFGAANIAGQLIANADGKSGSVTKAVTASVDSVINGVSNVLETQLFSGGGGVIGQVAATSGLSTTLTLADSSQAVNFNVGMQLNLDPVQAGGSGRTGVVTVTAIDRDAGTLTLGGALSGISGAATLDYIFSKGDNALGFKGLAAWLPLTVSSNDSFFGVNRSVDRTRLAGTVLDATNPAMKIEEALVMLLMKISEQGGEADTIFVNQRRYTDLINALGSKVSYVNSKIAGVGFTGVEIHGGTGAATVIPANKAPADRAYALAMDSWELQSAGPLPQVLSLDSELIRISNQDAYEVRVGGYGQLVCFRPVDNGVVLLPTS